MSYAKKTWTLVDPITDVALNNIESGVDTAHDVLDATGTPIGLSAATTNAIGTATAKAKADHTHQVLANVTPSTQAIGDTALVGTSAALARADHKHAMPSFGRNANQVVAGNHIRCGSVSGNTVSQGTEYTMPFGHTFPVAPVVVTTLRVGANVNVIVRILSTTTTHFTYSVSNAGGGTGTVVANFNWIAMVNPFP